MREGHHLYSLGTLAQVKDIEAVPVVVLQAATERTAGDFFCQFLIPGFFCGFYGHTPISFDGIDTVSGIGGAGDGDIHLLGLVSGCGLFQFQ